MTTAGRFFQLTLRTLDVPAARRFYAEVLGTPGEAIDAVPLHEVAIARGARPHWLGFLEVPGEVAAAAAAFTERGATALAPRWVNPQGTEAAVMRDPGGAILALAKPPPGRPDRPGVEVGWYVLNTADAAGARETYGVLLGWSFGAPVDGVGAFAWQDHGEPVGSIAQARPGIHPHWLFLLRVAALGPSLDAVRGRGGRVTAELLLPAGGRAAACEDPQGAAFGLSQAPS